MVAQAKAAAAQHKLIENGIDWTGEEHWRSFYHQLHRHWTEYILTIQLRALEGDYSERADG